MLYKCFFPKGTREYVVCSTSNSVEEEQKKIIHEFNINSQSNRLNISCTNVVIVKCQHMNTKVKDTKYNWRKKNKNKKRNKKQQHFPVLIPVNGKGAKKNYKTQFRIKKIQPLTAGKNGRKMRLLVKISICLKAQKKQ